MRTLQLVIWTITILICLEVQVSASVNIEVTTDLISDPVVIGYAPEAPSVGYSYYLLAWTTGPTNCTYGGGLGPRPSGLYTAYVANPPFAPAINCSYTIYVDGAIVSQGSVHVDANPVGPTYKYSSPIHYFYNSPDYTNLPQKGTSHPDTNTRDPISYVNGEISLTQDDLVSGAAGGWGHTRSYCNSVNRMQGSPDLHGPGWCVNQMPYAYAVWDYDEFWFDLDGAPLGTGDELLVFWEANPMWFDAVIVNLGENDSKVFTPMDSQDGADQSLTTFQLQGDGEETLTNQTVDDVSYLVYRDAAGNQTWLSQIPAYGDPGVTYDGRPHSANANFLAYIDTAGHETDATYNGDNQITQISRALTSSATEVFAYTYTTSGEIASVKRNIIASGVTTTVRQAVYEYYPTGATISPPGTLERVSIENGSGTVIDQTYYRYYNGTEITNCYPNALKFVVNPREYDRMVGDGINPLGATDSTIASYASHYFEYYPQYSTWTNNEPNLSQYVTKHVINNNGIDAGGAYTYSYSYNSGSSNAPPYNWSLKTVEGLPDGNVTIVYSDYIGNIILKGTYDTSSDAYSSLVAYQYDGIGREIKEIDGSAISSFSDSEPDLGIVLSSAGGKITTYTYDDSGGLSAPSDLQSSVTETDASGTLSMPVSTTTYIEHSQFNTSTDTSWVDDATPVDNYVSTNDGYGDQSWIWEPSTSMPSSFHGTLAHASDLVSGFHQHYFTGATTAVTPSTGDDLFTYVYLDPANPPDEIMLLLNDGSTWEHAAYWGSDEIYNGTDGTASQYYEGALPTTGGWVRLQFSAADVGVEGVPLTGMSFALYNGRAVFDYTGIRHSSVDSAWFDDAAPTGSTTDGTYEAWHWIGGTAPAAESASLDFRVALAAGMHQCYYNAETYSTTCPIGTGDSLHSYAYLDPVFPPDEVELQFWDGSTWHRAYWGADDMYVAGEYHVGSLPATGAWVELSVPASALGLEGSYCMGMAFTLYNGQAWFDNAGKTSYAPSGPERCLVASQTTYRDSSSTGELTTTYDYTFTPDTLAVTSKVTTFPMIDTDENGTGDSNAITDILDPYERVKWESDQDEFLHYTAYDLLSGAIIEHIDDVDSSLTSYFTDLPAGWSTPSGGGLNLCTQYVCDPMGRMMSKTDPKGNVTYCTHDDPNHEMRTYTGWQSSTSMPLLPTQVIREDRAHGYDEFITMATTPTCSSGTPTGTESIGSLRSLRREFYDAGKRVTAVDTYAYLTGLTYSTSPLIGTLGINYFEKTIDYDLRNRPSRIANEVGTISRTIYDSENHELSTWVGTNDTPTTGSWSPTNNTGSSNMTETESRCYDIDGNVTTITAHPTGSPTTDRATRFWYDFANRCIAWKYGVQSSESTGVGRLLTYLTLDYRGFPKSTSVYAADNVTMTLTSGVWYVPSDTLLVSYRTNAYDAKGQCYTTTVYGVDPTSGDMSSTGLTSNFWYNARGHVIKQEAPGGLVTKNQWDGNGRLIRVSQTDGGADSSWSDAGNQTGDAVLHQDQFTYDANDNLTLIIKKDRFDSETTTGDLGDASTAPLARVSYEGRYVDAVNRLTARVDVGTNGGSSYTRPSLAPSRSPTTHVWSTVYNDAGLIATTTDPRNISTAFGYDARALQTSMIEAYDASVNTGLPSGSNNRTTLSSYDGIGHLLSVTASMPTGTASQTTAYEYTATTSGGSTLNSNDLLSTIAFPDPTTGSASSSSSHQQHFTYNSIGQKTTSTDQNGSVHTYAFDVLGRPLSDAVTTLGSGVDGSIRRLTTDYNLQGYPWIFTSYDAVSAGTVVNQVQHVYNDLGQLITEYQAPNGSINTSTSPKVQWTFDDLVGAVNESRISSLVYPNGRSLTYNYSSGIDSAISRISYISDAAGSSSGIHLEDYRYLGLQTIVAQQHPEPGFDYTLLKQGSEANGDAGDPYTGIDRFGQLVDCRWLTSSTGIAVDRFQYGYDNVGNVLYENNKVSSSFSVLYGANGTPSQLVYDPLNRMTSFARGTLSTSGTNTTPLGAPYVSPILDTVSTVNHPSSSHPVSGEQAWTFDQLSNWTSTATDGTTDTRTHNAQNQVTATSDYSAIGYDSNGNLTSQTGETTNVFDAWNRGISIRGSTFTYDALGRRVTESDNTDSQYFYYAGQQMIENAPQSGATVRHQQLVYGIDYIDHVILRDRDADNSGDTGSLGGEDSGLEERLYYTHNRQFSVTGLVSQTGTVLERTIYDPYGESQYFSASYASPTATSSYANNVSFTGRWVDPTGELYFRARYYDPELGRFISQDPMMFIDGMSMYCGYFAQNGLDPLGLWWTWSNVGHFFAGAAEAAVGAVVGAVVVTAVALVSVPVAVGVAVVGVGVGAFCATQQLYNAVTGNETTWYGRQTGQTLNPDQRAKAAGSFVGAAISLGMGGALKGRIPFGKLKWTTFPTSEDPTAPVSDYGASSSRGSTADSAKGTSLPRNLRESLAAKQAAARPLAGQELPLPMTDIRWPASDGWVKMQQIVNPGGGEGPVNVHYLYNTQTGAVDDPKIVLPGSR